MITPREMQLIEQRAFAAGATPEMLMESAGGQMADAVRQFCPRTGTCLAVFGKGHNGGDALVTARILSESGWRVILIPAYPEDALAPLTAKKWRQAGLCETRTASDLEHWRTPVGKPCVILDGLLGIGAHGSLREPVRAHCRFINRLRNSTAARVFALDIPSGLDGDTGVADADAVIADVTLCVGFVKSGLLADGAERHVGRLAILSLEALTRFEGQVESLVCATPNSLRSFWKRRPSEMHKGDAGRVTLVAGGIGTIGAALLCASGALRAGAGLVTLCVPESIYPAAASRAPVECMVRPLQSLEEALTLKADALAIGPGLGNRVPDQAIEVIKEFQGPAVIDADALNILGNGRLHILSTCRGARILTPHPGEMARLAPHKTGVPRRKQVEDFTSTWPVTLLLKGSRTLIGTKGKSTYANTTGNPGMASGGMGDVLTGVCAALLAQGVDCHETAALSAWLCGRAAEFCISSGLRSEESLLASDVADALGHSFEALLEGGA